MVASTDFDFGHVDFESDQLQVLSISPEGRDFSFPLKETPINFSVLKSDGLLSNRWGVKTSKKGDTYVYCRDVPDAEKISLHASGRQHISMTDEMAERVGADSRFGNVWEEPEFTSEAVATFSLVFPPWGIGIDPHLEEITKDELLIVGHKERLVVVGFLILDATKTLRVRMPHFSLGRLPLGPDKTLHIMAWKEPQKNLKEEIQRVLPQVSHTSAQLGLGEGEYTLRIQAYRGRNSAFMMVVPIRYTPQSNDA